MAFYTQDIQLDNTEIDFIGYDPEAEKAYIRLQRTIKVEDSNETVWVNHKIELPYELLKQVVSEIDLLIEQMKENGEMHFDLRKPVLTN